MRITVFAGSSGLDVFRKEAYGFGELMALTGHSLAYGGSDLGCMGSVAHGVHDNGGHVLAISLERFSHKKLFSNNYTEIKYKSLRGRQQRLIDSGKAFVLLPGGVGSMYEFFDVLSLITLGDLPCKTPILIYNYKNYWKSIIDQLACSVNQSFINDSFSHETNIKTVTNLNECEKWLALL